MVNRFSGRRVKVEFYRQLGSLTRTASKREEFGCGMIRLILTLTAVILRTIDFDGTFVDGECLFHGGVLQLH